MSDLAVQLTALVVAATALVSALVVVVRQISAALTALEGHLLRQDAVASGTAVTVDGHLAQALQDVADCKARLNVLATPSKDGGS